MYEYVINRNSQPGSKDNEVHRLDCPEIQQSTNLEPLGIFNTCHGAVVEATSRGYLNADGCEICSPDCHKS